MGKLVQKAELAEILNTSERTLTNWQKLGMPISVKAGKRGHPNLYDTFECILWWAQKEFATPSDGEQSSYDFETERARLTKHQADLADLKVRETRGQLIPAQLVLELCQARAGSVRAKVLAIPSKLRSQMPNIDLEVFEELDDKVREALQEVADSPVPDSLMRRIAPGLDDDETEDCEPEPDHKRDAA